MSDPWVPTPAPDVPTPTVILGHLSPAPGEPAEGYITPEDMQAIVQALLSISYWVAHDGSEALTALSTEVAVSDAAIADDLAALHGEIGDPSLLVYGTPEHDLVHYLLGLDARINVLETAGGGGTPLPAPEGSLEVDLYSTSFVRLRDTGNLLGDGQVHTVTAVLATVPGPGGVVITEPPGVPAGTSGTWYDKGGTLGPVQGATGTAVTQTTLRNWVKYSDPNDPTGYYLLWVREDTVTDPTHPRLVVERVANVR